MPNGRSASLSFTSVPSKILPSSGMRHGVCSVAIQHTILQQVFQACTRATNDDQREHRLAGPQLSDIPFLRPRRLPHQGIHHRSQMCGYIGRLDSARRLSFIGVE